MEKTKIIDIAGYVEFWGRLAKVVFEKAQKGRGGRIVGRLKQERWNDEM